MVGKYTSGRLPKTLDSCGLENLRRKYIGWAAAIQICRKFNFIGKLQCFPKRVRVVPVLSFLPGHAEGEARRVLSLNVLIKGIRLQISN